MKLRLFVGFAVLAAMATTGLGQTLPEQTTAAGIAGGIAMKAAPSGLAATKKAKMLRKKAEERFFGTPVPGSHDTEPFMPPGKGGKAGVNPLMGPDGLPALPAPPPPAEPWTWRLKGLAFGKGPTIAAFQSATGQMVWVKAGETLDNRSKIVSISKSGVTVLVDKQKMQLRPW